MAQPYYVRTFDDTVDTLAGNVDAKDRVVEVVESHRSLAALARRYKEKQSKKRSNVLRNHILGGQNAATSSSSFSWGPGEVKRIAGRRKLPASSHDFPAATP
jgi:hypothetical protein